MVKILIHLLLLSGGVFSFPAAAMQLLLSSIEGDTVIIYLQERETFQLAHSRPLHAKTSTEFETKSKRWTGVYKKQNEQIVLWADARELGRIQFWDQTGQIKAQLFLIDAKKAQAFSGLMFR